MDHQTFKIYNEQDFKRITKGIKVAQCMQSRSSTVLETEKVLTQLEDLVVSDSLCCSFCNTVFEDKSQQRLHYKLDWHRYNLKQRLNGLKSVSEDGFNLLADTGDVSSLSGSDMESENDDETATSETGGSPSGLGKNNDSKQKNSSSKLKRQEKKGKSAESDSTDSECSEETSKQKKVQTLLVMASRHSKVFFENEAGNIFSIYRCLLHSKKEIPDVDDVMIEQALNSGKKHTWTVIMVGGGHFAAAIFEDGQPIVHKTFHSYTVRAKQGGSQSSRDNRSGGSHPKSAGASLRRYNEMSLTQHVQEILESWAPHINNSSLILYRAVGPQNRTVLFGGKNPALDKNDSRLRPLPFPTRRATFNEVKRVYDILSTMEIYGSAADFTDCFPISPRQPIRRKVSKVDLLGDIQEKEENCLDNTNSINNSESARSNEKNKTSQLSPERLPRNNRMHIDRAKPRKSPNRPLPDIVARLARSSSESEFGVLHESNIPLYEQNLEIDFQEHLQAFQDTVPRYMKNKKNRKQKKKVKKELEAVEVVADLPKNEAITTARTNLQEACETGNTELLFEVINSFKDITSDKDNTDEQTEYMMNDVTSNNKVSDLNAIIDLINTSDEDGNTMLHIAAIKGHAKILWILMENGWNPCDKNKKSQTAYAVATDKEARNTFRRFMGANPDKFNYEKSQIPGPLTDEIEQKYLEKKRQLKKFKREKEKTKRKEFEIKKQEEETKQRFLNLTDREKRALAAEQRILRAGGSTCINRCFQCGVDMTGQVPFEYNANRFCSMPCLKEHRLHHKFIL